jgi:hypothetical protein
LGRRRREDFLDADSQSGGTDSFDREGTYYLSRFVGVGVPFVTLYAQIKGTISNNSHSSVIQTWNSTE